VSTQTGISGAGVNNVSSAVSVEGAAVYVGFCGVCDPVTQASGNFAAFHNGVATNVQPGCTPHTGSSACWHKAAAIGLPDRYIQGIAVDPRNLRTVYVALSGYMRRWYPNRTPGGTVYVSHDGGQHFTNISGNLPKVPANALVLRNGRVYVGTDLGVYTASQSSRPSSWVRVGPNLPNASVFDLRLNPSGSHLVAATHGRGVWIYDFGAPAAAAYQAKDGVGAGGGFRLPGLPHLTLGRAELSSLGLLLLLAALALRFGLPGRRWRAAGA
jgi:hypothetical protein